MSQGQKLHPQNTQTLPFSEHASHEEARSLAAPAHNSNYLNFLNSNHLSPCLRPPSLHPLNISKPCQWKQIWNSFSHPIACCLVNIPLLHCQPQRLSVWLTARWAKDLVQQQKLTPPPHVYTLPSSPSVFHLLNCDTVLRHGLSLSIVMPLARNAGGQLTWAAAEPPQTFPFLEPML